MNLMINFYLMFDLFYFPYEIHYLILFYESYQLIY